MANVDAYEVWVIDYSTHSVGRVEVPYEAVDRHAYESGIPQGALKTLFDYYGAPRRCGFGCELVDTGCKWAYCRNCDQPFEFKNWEWRAMNRRTT